MDATNINRLTVTQRDAAYNRIISRRLKSIDLVNDTIIFKLNDNQKYSIMIRLDPRYRMDLEKVIQRRNLAEAHRMICEILDTFDQ